MSLRLQMLQVARLAPRILGDSTDLCRKFFLSQLNEDGGFKDRAGKSDLYYTVFGLEGLSAVSVHSPQSTVHSPQSTVQINPGAVAYLQSFGNGDRLDFVHLCCLARCWADAINPVSSTGFIPAGTEILARLKTYRSEDGGFNPLAGSKHGTAYGAFLGLGAYQDCGAALPEPLRLVQSLKYLETKDNAWANDKSSAAAGSTNATAAAVTVLGALGQPLNPDVGDWFLAQAHPQGGFRASPSAPVPDLLSTATALHALASLEVSVEGIKEPTLDFIDTLWTNEGGFYGHWGDDHLDCEYTFYGLLALGHLSL